ncbi:MAG TPA: glycosyltransferase [Xanthobacteraceae bacterium]
MRILFTSSIPYLPQIYGGLNTNTHELCGALMKRGHSPAVLTRLSYANAFGARRLLTERTRGRRLFCDTSLGYPVFRTREPWTMVAEIPHHDVAIMLDGYVSQFAAGFARRKIPAITYFHGLDFEDWTVEGRPATAADLPQTQYFANSRYTAARFRRRYGMDARIIRPVFHGERYRTERVSQNVVFINPVPEKGVELALEIAALCPEIGFVFVKGWPLAIGDHWRLHKTLRRLTNVRLMERCTDMRDVFRHCHILLAPSQWLRETWGRVASEAHFSGIPVIGSDLGGLPEAIGPGGILIGADQPAAVWATAVRRLWHDEELYLAKSRAAREYAARGELDLGSQIDLLMAGLERAVAQAQSSGQVGAAASDHVVPMPKGAAA